MSNFQAFSELLADWFTVHNVPQHLRRRLFEKLNDDVFDAGASFSLAVVADGGEKTEPEVQCTSSADNYVLVASKDLSAEDDIWLVDHCCTFRMRELRKHLETDESLRARLGRILAVGLSGLDARRDAQVIFDSVWDKVGSYRLPGAVDGGDFQHENYWFIHDEVGSAIATVVEETPNMKLEPIPICLPAKGGVFSAMWCIRHMEEGDIATRRAESSLETWGGREILSLMHGVGGSGDETEGNACQHAQKLCVEAWRRLVHRLEGVPCPSAEQRMIALPPSEGRTGELLRVFTDSQQVSRNLTDAGHFIVVDLPQEAHIIWVVHHSIEGLNDYPHARFISQFPEERQFTSKQGLLRLIQHTYGYVDWYQPSYDSTTQLREFIGDFVVRKASITGDLEPSPSVSHEDARRLRGCDGTNLWLSKPANMARSVDMTLSSNLTELLRAVETGPKVLCKYIANTATLRRRKFDLRFIVAVNSFTSERTPLEAYVYNTFWTRFALRDYSLDDVDCYEKHWTVMNYTNPEELLQLHDTDFVEEFNGECASAGYGEAAWERVAYPKILKMLREAFAMVVTGSGDYSRCRAMYGVDVMLRTERCVDTGALTLEPSLLEITFSPDCRRACKHHPTFFNDVFHTLFLGSPRNMTRL